MKLATVGDLAGNQYADDFDLAKFVEFKQRCYARVAAGQLAYGFGAKDPNPGSGAIDFVSIDCSGFVRTLLKFAAPATFKDMPDGSFLDDDWFGRMGFKRTEYANFALQDGRLRVAIHRANGRGGDPVGHIWLGINGHTVESFGGHGPGERSWDTPKLVAIVDDCFVIW